MLFALIDPMNSTYARKIFNHLKYLKIGLANI